MIIFVAFVSSSLACWCSCSWCLICVFLRALKYKLMPCKFISVPGFASHLKCSIRLSCISFMNDRELSVFCFYLSDFLEVVYFDGFTLLLDS